MTLEFVRHHNPAALELGAQAGAPPPLPSGGASGGSNGGGDSHGGAAAAAGAPHLLPAVRVPEELLAARPTVLEDYVRRRLMQFVAALALRVRALSAAPDGGGGGAGSGSVGGLGGGGAAEALALLDRAAAQALQLLPPPDYGRVPVERLELQLVFRHDCL